MCCLELSRVQSYSANLIAKNFSCAVAVSVGIVKCAIKLTLKPTPTPLIDCEVNLISAPPGF